MPIILLSIYLWGHTAVNIPFLARHDLNINIKSLQYSYDLCFTMIKILCAMFVSLFDTMGSMWMWLWPILWCYCKHFLERLKKTMRNLDMIGDLHTEMS